MECKKIQDLLSPYLDGELETPKRRAVEDHLKICPACAELLSFMQETRASLSSFPELEVRPSLRRRLYALPEKKKKRFQGVIDVLLRPSLQPVFAAAAVLLIMISFYAFHPDRSLINKTLERQLHLGYSKVKGLYVEAESLTHSLGEYKDNLFVSIKSLPVFDGDKEHLSKT